MTKLGYVDGKKFKILAIDNSTNTYWRNPIVDYLESLTTFAEQKSGIVL